MHIENSDNCGSVSLQAIVPTLTVRKQAQRVESRMEYYWKLRSKNAQNIRTQCVRYNSICKFAIYKTIKYFPSNTHNRLVVCIEQS